MRAVGEKYKKKIMRADPDKYIRQHVKGGHVGSEPQTPDPGTLTAIKAERHRKSVDERIDQLYDLALVGCKIALDGKDPRGLATCIAQGIAATSLMGKSEPTEQPSIESGFIKGYMERAKDVYSEKNNPA